jgi:histone deacetylase 6
MWLCRDPSKFYPYNAGFKEEAGEGKGEGFNINIPWTRRGMGDAEYEVGGLRRARCRQ